MNFSITGLSHRNAPVEVRELLAFDAAAIPAALQALKRRPGFLEGMILSTCNRVEVALASEEGSSEEPLVDDFLAETRQLKPDSIRPYLYRYSGSEAIRHLFRVACSLDSMVVGEPQILGQLKSAYAVAKQEGAVSGFLDGLLTRAFSVAKRVRTETEIGASAVSVSYAAVELAREIFGSLKESSIMLIGAGKMSEAAARHLTRNGVSRILVTNRTADRAAEMARLFNGSIVEYDRFAASLHEVDIAITSSGAPHYILTREQMKRVVDARRNRPIFLIDIAVPRNIEPSVNELDHVFLYDIDDLQNVVDRNRNSRLQIANEAERIVAEETERMLSRLRVKEITPTIVSLQEQLENVRSAEMARMRGKLGPLTPQQEEALEQLTRGIISKIAHGPISELRKQAAEPDGIHLISAIRKVFRLGD
ncbi:MAG TPA: glutamyl-tRNA reductase [Bryobacteraceae bacterium]|nr:glutamyl-tRNA reductase [Bryobacteraceae bacterium]